MTKSKVSSQKALARLLRTAMKECVAGEHNLMVIMSDNNGFDETTEVRWCRNCGSVVIDLECDGRVQPGRIMAMKSPQVSKLAQNL